MKPETDVFIREFRDFGQMVHLHELAMRATSGEDETYHGRCKTVFTTIIRG